MLVLNEWKYTISFLQIDLPLLCTKMVNGYAKVLFLFNSIERKKEREEPREFRLTLLYI